MGLKFFTVLLICILFFLKSFSQFNSTTILIGKWEAPEKGKIMKVEFTDSNHVILDFGEGTIDRCTYQIDFTKNPVWFDITNTKGRISKKIIGLIRILNDTSFNWYLSRDGNRPLDYSHPSLKFKKKNTH